MKKLSNILFIMIPMLFSNIGLATEIDSFTHRYNTMSNSTQKINKITNGLIDKAINLANLNSPNSCNENQMYKIMHNTLAGMGAGSWAALESTIEEDKSIEKRRPAMKNSIYRKTYGPAAPALVMAPLGSTVNINGHVIGTDKFGHFVDQGHEYFYIAYLKGKGEDAAMKYGEFSENSFYGMLTTGIYAYGDLAANYQGMQFYANLTGNYKYTENPMLSCVNNKWVKNYDFKWEDYVDEAMDEGINCTGQSALVWSTIEPQLLRLEREDPAHRYQCPVKPEVCPILVKKYGNVASRIISPKCR